MEGFSMKNSNKKGFTLVELVVVIAIIGVLAAILVPSMMGYVKKSRLKTANGNAKTAYNAIADCLTDLETQGMQFANGISAVSSIDCTTVPTATVNPTADDTTYLEYCVKKSLGSNGKDGGFTGIIATDPAGTASSKNAPLYTVQWHKTATDAIIGQYPEAPQTVDDAQTISWGTVFHKQ